MSKIKQNQIEIYDLVIIGAGMGSISAASLLAKEGKKIAILEQNWQAGGCMTSYWRKGHVFEAGATTLVGLDEGMPLKYLLDQTDISLIYRELAEPMTVIQKNKIIKIPSDIESWINQSGRLFDTGNQKKFWQLAWEVSQFVWAASLRYVYFPPDKPSDYLSLIKRLQFNDLKYVPYAFKSTLEIMNHYGVDTPEFIDFVNEQLIITAQNGCHEVNFLFGATALCYTHYTNAYIDGGLKNLINPFLSYLESNHVPIYYRTPVIKIEKRSNYFEIHGKQQMFKAKKILSGIPLNNLLEIFPSLKLPYQKKAMPSRHLNSAFQVSLAFMPHREYTCLHYQIHLGSPLSGVISKSIFLSISHPEDKKRSDTEGVMVASVSTHIANPEITEIEKEKLIGEILDVLNQNHLIKKENIIHVHSSDPQDWEKWTGRKWGFVGGYPQFMSIKPWQMNSARLTKDIYLAGDTAYPGQGIPGVVLSGIIAAKKIKNDWKNRF